MFVPAPAMVRPLPPLAPWIRTLVAPPVLPLIVTPCVIVGMFAPTSITGTPVPSENRMLSWSLLPAPQ